MIFDGEKAAGMKMLRIFHAAAETLAVWAICCAAAGPPSAHAEAAETPVIRSGCEVDYPPFCIVDPRGQAGGFSVELLRAALKAMGRDVRFRTGPWAEVRGWLERGEVDALPLVGRTPEREAVFDFTIPYLTLHGAIVVRKDETSVRDLGDLRGRRVAVMKGDNAEEYLRRRPRDFTIQTTLTFSDALRRLSEGQCDAVVMQRLLALRLLPETGLFNLRIVEQPIADFSQDFCFAVKDDDRKTLALLNEGLALVMADGTYRRLYSKWFAALELPSNRALVVGGDRDYPPFEFLDEKGRPAGYCVDLVRAAAQEVGLDIEIRLGAWPEIVQALDQGDIDAVEHMCYSPERLRKFDFSQPHMVNHFVGVVRRGSGPPPSGIAELTGKSLVVRNGDIMHEFALQNGLGARLTTVGTPEDALRAVSEGKQDCALVSRMTALYCIKERHLENLIVGRRPILTPECCFAVPKGNRALLAQLSEGLSILEQTGASRRIHDKWMGGYGEQVSFRQVIRYVILMAAPLLAVTLLAMGWSWSMRRQVARRTDELRESEERYRTLFESSRDAIMTLEPPSWRLTAGNPACVWMFRTRDVTDFKARLPWEWSPEFQPDGRPSGEKARELIKKALKEGAHLFEWMHRRADGQVFPATVLLTRVDLRGETLVQATVRDVSDIKKAETERAALEARLRQSQRLESIGTLARGIAHEVNNPIMGIINYAELIGDKAASGSDTAEFAREISIEARRVATVVRHLFAFSEQKENHAGPSRIVDIVEAVLSMIRNALLTEEIAVAVDIPAGLPEVRCRSQQIQQVLMNLLANARDALNEKYPGPHANKKILITATEVEMTLVNGSPPAASGAVGKAGDPEPPTWRPTMGTRGGEPAPRGTGRRVRAVRLTVEDHGPGIPPDIRERSFDPFFTTKDRTKSAGLGLSISHGIVKDHGGALGVESVVGEWTRFHVDLPIAEQRPDLDGAAGEAAGNPGVIPGAEAAPGSQERTPTEDPA